MSSSVVISFTSSASIGSPTTSSSTSLPSSSSSGSSSNSNSLTTSRLGFSTIIISTTLSLPPTQTSSSTNGTTQSISRLNPGTLAGLVIGGLLAGVVLGGCIWFLIIFIRRRMRPRKPAVESQPEERLMHLEKMRGQAVPPLRDGLAIQSLPPSRNIRVLNWIARTRGAGPPSISQQTVMSERSVHEERRDAPLLDDLFSDSSSESRYSSPSTVPRRSEPQKSSSQIVERPNVSDSPSFINMD